ncbi:MAG: sigma factor-like helix-turn-helix DNA-binding protein [Anaerolineales bacterium]
MKQDTHKENYRVVIVDADFYARHALNAYLAWDRRTRVIGCFARLPDLQRYLETLPDHEHPDVILVDGKLLPSAEDTQREIATIRQHSAARLLVLAHTARPEIAEAAHTAGAQGYLLRDDVGLHVSWLIVWANDYDFVVSPQTAAIFPEAAVLPEGRTYPDLTNRVRQALMLCVVEGMSAELAADEMGLSPHTIRTYIKEGYSILEAADEIDFPAALSPQEKAFMRFTALALNDEYDLPDEDG